MAIYNPPLTSSSGWVIGNNTAPTNPVFSGGVVAGSGIIVGYYPAVYTSATTTDGQIVSVVLNSAPTSSPGGVFLRGTNNFATQHVAALIDNTSTVYIVKVADGAGSSSTIEQTFTGATFASGDTLTFKCLGNLYTVLKNGVSVGTWTDISHVISTGPAYRYCGVAVQYTSNSVWSQSLKTLTIQDNVTTNSVSESASIADVANVTQLHAATPDTAAISETSTTSATVMPPETATITESAGVSYTAIVWDPNAGIFTESAQIGFPVTGGSDSGSISESASAFNGVQSGDTAALTDSAKANATQFPTDSTTITESATVSATLKADPDTTRMDDSPIRVTYTVYLTGSGTWTVPSNVLSVTAECIGGGGSACTVSGGSSVLVGPGAAGGSYAKRLFTGLIPNTPISYSVGAGGAVAGSGYANNGGTSWFSVNGPSGCVAVGGQGGVTVTNGGPGLGTTAGCYGTVVYRGGHGCTASFTTGTSGNAGSGGGGAGSTGPGGDATGTALSGVNTVPGTGISPGGAGGLGATTNASGAPGNTYGGGAGGTEASANSTNPGASGGVGMVKLTYSLIPQYNKYGSDTGGMSDAVRLASRVADTVTATETNPALVTATSLATDSATVSESVPALLIESAETVPVSDVGGLNWSVADTITGTDAANVLIPLSESFQSAETPLLRAMAMALDSISAADLAKIVLSSADFASTADTANDLIGTNIPGADTATATESAQIGTPIAGSDVITASDAIKVSPAPTDSISTVDTATIHSNQTIAAFDVALLTDSPAVGPNSADTAAISDFAVLAKLIPASDTLAMADSVKSGPWVSDQAALVEQHISRILGSGRLHGPRMFFPFDEDSRRHSIPKDPRKLMVGPEDRVTLVQSGE